MPFVLGIDEAGRGPVLGPMVLAGVYIDAARGQELLSIGVKDSKMFAGASAQKRRARLAEKIRELALRVAVRVAWPPEIDAKNLGELEREKAASIISEINPDGLILADGAAIFSPLARQYPTLVAQNGADRRHIAVAAASIVAKTERDRLFGEIRGRYEPEFGEIRGGGYPNPATLAFLAAYRERFGGLPPEARRKWRIGTPVRA